MVEASLSDFNTGHWCMKSYIDVDDEDVQTAHSGCDVRNVQKLSKAVS